MIQRPQSIYLLLGAALLAAFVALGHVWSPGVSGMYPWLGTVTYVLAVLTAAVALGAIFLYKDRARQRRVIGAAQALDLLLVLPLLVGLYSTTSDATVAEGTAYESYLVALVPLVAYVLLRMARSGVDRDISTVRSMDRLR